MSALSRREAILAAGATSLGAVIGVRGRALLELRRKGSKVGTGYTGSLVVGVSPSGGR